MLIYEYRIRDEFERVKAYALRLKQAFDDSRPVADLAQDTQNLVALSNILIEMLPTSIRSSSNLQRHLGWMKHRLGEGSPELCAGDINDICEHDLPALEHAFLDWCKAVEHYDSELRAKVIDLVVRQELDSAVRKAFVVLKERMVRHFNLPDDADGLDLVNRAFGRSGVIVSLTDSDRQAFRDLLAGLYGIFRNRVAHGDEEVTWSEADAVISMINFALLRIDTMNVGP